MMYAASSRVNRLVRSAGVKRREAESVAASSASSAESTTTVGFARPTIAAARAVMMPVEFTSMGMVAAPTSQTARVAHTCSTPRGRATATVSPGPTPRSRSAHA